MWLRDVGDGLPPVAATDVDVGNDATRERRASAAAAAAAVEEKSGENGNVQGRRVVSVPSSLTSAGATTAATAATAAALDSWSDMR